MSRSARSPCCRQRSLVSKSTNGSISRSTSESRSRSSSYFHDTKVESLTSSNEDDYFGEWRGRRISLVGAVKWICDEAELERQEAQHWLLRLLFGYPFLGPVSEVMRETSGTPRILDIATGTGVWAMDMAEMFPFADVIGCDNIPIQPKMVPVNCEFELVDVDQHLPYVAGSFDLIHIRFASLRVKSFSHLLESAYTLLRPRGLLLILESTYPPIQSDGKSTTATQAWSDAFSRSVTSAGLAPFDLDEAIDCFEPDDEVVSSEMRVPIGPGEGGRIGQISRIELMNTMTYLDSMRYWLVEYGGYSDAEVDVLNEAFMRDVKERCLYTRYHSLSVRKGISVEREE